MQSTAIPPRIGVLALQGDFAEHISLIHKIGSLPVEVRYAEQLEYIQGLIIPGGESTTITQLLHKNNFIEPLYKFVQQGTPLWGTCAGLIIIARELTDPYPIPMGLLNVTVSRNWFGRQIQSFECDIVVQWSVPFYFRAVFIRAPVILEVGKNVQVIASLPEPNSYPVAVREGNILATAFHPELTDDKRFHEMFNSIVVQNMSKRPNSNKNI